MWPVQLHAPARGRPDAKALGIPDDARGAAVWKEVVDEFTGDPTQFGERHYKEFVTFLPYVQRFLYGEGYDATGPDTDDRRFACSAATTSRKRGSPYLATRSR